MKLARIGLLSAALLISGGATATASTFDYTYSITGGGSSLSGIGFLNNEVDAATLFDNAKLTTFDLESYLINDLNVDLQEYSYSDGFDLQGERIAQTDAIDVSSFSENPDFINATGVLINGGDASAQDFILKSFTQLNADIENPPGLGEDGETYEANVSDLLPGYDEYLALSLAGSVDTLTFGQIGPNNNLSGVNFFYQVDGEFVDSASILSVALDGVGNLLAPGNDSFLSTPADGFGDLNATVASEIFNVAPGGSYEFNASLLSASVLGDEGGEFSLANFSNTALLESIVFFDDNGNDISETIEITSASGFDYNRFNAKFNPSGNGGGNATVPEPGTVLALLGLVFFGTRTNFKKA